MKSLSHELALEKGFRPLVAHAARLAAEGRTTLEELRSVVPYEQILRQRERLGSPEIRKRT